jgi:hypothetical protein
MTFEVNSIRPDAWTVIAASDQSVVPLAGSHVVPLAATRWRE